MFLGIARGSAQALKLNVEQPQLIFGAVTRRKLLDGLARGLEQPMELCLLGARDAASRHDFGRALGQDGRLVAVRCDDQNEAKQSSQHRRAARLGTFEPARARDKKKLAR
eukprot:scaffold37999_cov60-Phaeocystis_antarctica.AAC.7